MKAAYLICFSFILGEFQVQVDGHGAAVRTSLKSHGQLELTGHGQQASLLPYTKEEVASTLDKLVDVMGPFLLPLPYILFLIPFAIPALPLALWVGESETKAEEKYDHGLSAFVVADYTTSSTASTPASTVNDQATDLNSLIKFPLWFSPSGESVLWNITSQSTNQTQPSRVPLWMAVSSNVHHYNHQAQNEDH